MHLLLYEYFSNNNAFSWFALKQAEKLYQRNWQVLITREFSLGGKCLMNPPCCLPPAVIIAYKEAG